MTMLDTRTSLDIAIHALNQAHSSSRWRFRTVTCDVYGNTSIILGGGGRLVVFIGNDGTLACTDDDYNLIEPASVGIDEAACLAVLAAWPEHDPSRAIVADPGVGDDALYARHDGWVNTPGLGWETR